jgi:dipeptidase D
VRIEVRGLRGGHSGMNINEGRGNAIKLLVRVLRQLERRWPIRLSSLSGGTARNALPREAFAMVSVPPEALADLGALLTRLQTVFRQELAGVDEQVSVSLSLCMVENVMIQDDQTRWLASLHAAPQGVRRMSVQLPGVVETSDNLGVVKIDPESGECCFMVRSLFDSAAIELADEIASLFALSGTRAEQSGYYPGWAPNPASPLLAVCQAAFRQTFATEAKTQVVHAGLECGLIAGKYPDMDMVSFGPTIHGAHAPGEAVEVASVERCWRLLKAILAAIA